MKTMNKVLAVSILAMLAVPAAHAKIVAETMLSETSGHYSSTHTVQDEIDTKQATISDLSTIRSGAAAGATALQSVTENSDAGVVTNVSKNGTAITMTKAKIANADVADNAAIAGTKVAAATTTARGTIEIATDAEATAGSLENVAVNPKQLKAAAAAAQAAATPGIATTSATGVVKGGGNVAIANDGTMSVDLSGKADKATTLSGYGITDAYTKTETGTQITNAVNALDSTSTGTGTVVKGVSQTDGKVAVTVGTISNADVASDAAIAQSKISGLSTSLSGKVDVAQGTTNKDKVLITDATSGDVTTTAFVHQAGYNAQATDKDNTIPSVFTVEKIVLDAVGDYVEKDQESNNANKAMITNGTGQVVPGQIATGMIADSAVTTAKINGKAVTTAKIADGAVGATQLASNAVTTVKITDKNVTKAKLEDSVQTSLDKADSAVQSVTTGTSSMANGTISVDGTAVAVKGLGSAAYKDVTNTYSATGTDPVTGTAVASAISGVAATANGAVQTDQTTTNKNKVMSTTSTGQVTASTITGTNGVSASVADDGSVSVSGVNADTSNKGVMKLYTSTGTNTDGTMTQNAIKTAVDAKLATTISGDANGLIVRNSSGTAAKGTGTDITVSGTTVTVNHATKADQDGSGQNIANTYATKTEVSNNYATKNMELNAVPATPSTEGVYVLTAKITGSGTNATTTYYWEDIGR